MASKTRTEDGEAFGLLETALRRQIKDTLGGVNSSYDNIQTRLQSIEQRLPENLRSRLDTVEDHCKHEDAMDISQSLAQLTSKISMMQSQIDLHQRSLEHICKKDPAPPTPPALQNSDSAVQDLMQWKDRSESDQRSQATLEMWSADEIAGELLHRLAKGQQLASELAQRVHLATAARTIPSAETAPQSASQVITRTSESLAESRKRSASSASFDSAEDGVGEKSASKRFKSAQTANGRRSGTWMINRLEISQPATEAELSKKEPSKKEMSKQELSKQEFSKEFSKEPSKKEPGKKEPTCSKKELSKKKSSNQGLSKELSKKEVSTKEPELTPKDEPRRSSRPPKPSRNPEYITWLEVEADKRRRVFV